MCGIFGNVDWVYLAGSDPRNFEKINIETGELNGKICAAACCWIVSHGFAHPLLKRDSLSYEIFSNVDLIFRYL